MYAVWGVEASLARCVEGQKLASELAPTMGLPQKLDMSLLFWRQCRQALLLSTRLARFAPCVLQLRYRGSGHFLLC